MYRRPWKINCMRFIYRFLSCGNTDRIVVQQDFKLFFLSKSIAIKVLNANFITPELEQINGIK